MMTAIRTSFPWSLCSSSDAKRDLHSSLGLASLAVGIYHIAHCLQHGYTAPITQSEIVWSGAIHLGCSVMGLPLLRFGDKREAQRISAI